MAAIEAIHDLGLLPMALVENFQLLRSVQIRSE
jgi:hypothetical protein